MTSLLEIKQYILRFYMKNETYIAYVWKFLLALIAIAMINSKLGFMSSLTNIAIVLMAALLCAILPANFIVFMSAVFILGHLYALYKPGALMAFMIFLLMFLLYFRFSPKDTLAVLLTPILYYLHLPFVMPLAMGLLGSPTSVVSVGFGLVIVLIINYFSGNASTLGGDGVEEVANQFHTMVSGILGDKTMLVMIGAFAVTIVIVYIIRRSSIDYAWRIAIGAGAITLIISMLIGDMAMNANVSFLGVIVGTAISAALMLVVEFFAFNVDYTRTEKVQFEDDEYYYYVKAVPKVILSTPERRVKKINKANQKRK